MLKSVQRREVVHAGHKTWPGDCDMTPRYIRQVTLEPCLLAEAWGTLSEDTFPLEVATYPAIFHRAFKLQLGKRARNERKA